jgi:hypothetical protein
VTKVIQKKQEIFALEAKRNSPHYRENPRYRQHYLDMPTLATEKRLPAKF